MAYAAGKKAIGICDRCGFEYLRRQLYPQVKDLRETGWMVCPTCLDEDQPQLQLGRLRIGGPQALRNPRPDTGVTASRDGVSLRYEFLVNDESWAGTDAVVTHVAADSALGLNGAIKVAGSGADPAISLGSLAIDTSLYNHVEMRIKRTVTPSLGSGWVGTFSWTPTGSEDISPAEPVWEQMGDPYTVISWDLFGNAAWTGTVTDLNFKFYSFGSNPATNVTLQIDYIRLENWSERT